MSFINQNDNFINQNNDFNDNFNENQTDFNDSQNQEQNTKKRGLPNVPVYDNLLDPHRKNAKIIGFDFDTDTFENLIDCFTPEANIPVILGVHTGQLDKFCERAYGMNFHETYAKLSGITDSWSRKVIKNLSASGNSTALNIMAKHFMGLSDDNKNQGVNITIINDLKEDGED